MPQQVICAAHLKGKQSVNDVQVLEDHSRPVLSLAIADNKLFSGSYDYTIKVWSLDTLQRLKTLTGRLLTLILIGSPFFAHQQWLLKICHVCPLLQRRICHIRT